MIEVNSFPILETERLVLRQVTKEDAKSMLTYLSQEEVTKHIGLAPFKTVNEALDEISWYESIVEKKTGIRWGITLKQQGEMIGSCGFLNMASKHFRSEIGIELSKDYWGKGIASEAIEAVVTYGFEKMNLQRIEALIEPLNLSSQKLFERQGFVREGLLRNYEYTNGKFDNLFMYSLLEQEFDLRQEKDSQLQK